MDNTVGILTFIATINYGAEFQAYALVRAVREMGYCAELVNYTCPKIADQETPKLIRNNEEFSLSSFARNLLKYPSQRERQRRFREFSSSKIQLGRIMRGAQDILDSYRYIVVGSDQVWSSKITGGDGTFLLDGKRHEGQRLVSYAASFGDSYPDPGGRQRLSRELSKFDRISVREESGLAVLEQLGIAGGTTTIDPTLLLSKENWSEIAAPNNKDSYVFAYAVAEGRSTLEYARRVANEFGMELRYISAYGSRPLPHAKNCGSCSPSHFLSLIRDAAFVVTSSFHGMCFSILFNKQFRFAFAGDKGTSRLCSLAEKLGISAYDISNCDFDDKIDYCMVDKLLEDLRNESKEWLKASLYFQG
ncbi:polysaccharide pyruvyl transferase family protein [Collinsella sp. An271]|uniref:polysaccharide pyruvyl transferase family protein n=1 Tax=Collinsella sp. An271 TaxID=1965616 RepID=UPI001302E620|nr:polysaccharide pyruvyl transferase family protein [Collinsella sp. An271]